MSIRKDLLLLIDIFWVQKGFPLKFEFRSLCVSMKDSSKEVGRANPSKEMELGSIKRNSCGVPSIRFVNLFVLINSTDKAKFHDLFRSTDKCEARESFLIIASCLTSYG